MRARGFTLVELLIAMALIGLLTALLFGALHYTAQTAARGTALLDRASDLATTARFLRSALADARPLPEGADGVDGVDGSSRDTVAFSGRADRVALVGVPPPQLASSGFYRIEIALDLKKHVLKARWSPLLPDDAVTDAAVPPLSDLLAGVVRAEFGYFGAYRDAVTPVWHDTWEDQSALPRLVRLRIGFEDGTEAPALVIAVRTATGAGR
jgi:general secretion pathway protein J